MKSLHDYLTVICTGNDKLYDGNNLTLNGWLICISIEMLMNGGY